MRREFAVSGDDLERIAETLKRDIRRPHRAIDGSYEEGVIDTIAYVLGQSAYIAHERDWTNAVKSDGAKVKPR